MSWTSLTSRQEVHRTSCKELHRTCHRQSYKKLLIGQAIFWAHVDKHNIVILKYSNLLNEKQNKNEIYHSLTLSLNLIHVEMKLTLSMYFIHEWIGLILKINFILYHILDIIKTWPFLPHYISLNNNSQSRKNIIK